MDWLKLFTLLVAVASLCVTAEGAKKKIRIHLPQKVKHIHHHKKIYITNHPAPGHYAPAYMPSAEGAMAVPTSVALPPYSGAEAYEESGGGAPSHLVPLYRARGFYGPQPSEFSNDYDLAPPPEPTDASYLPQPLAFQDINYSPKKNKVVKANTESPRNKVSSSRKQRSKQRGPPKSQPQEDEHPVSNFHEQFYSDLDGSGTIKKIRRPHRVEKIIDGDTEHIHTYSEEHIHKLVYNDARVDPLAGSMSGIAGHASPLGFRNSPAILAYPSEHLATLGSMGTPPHLEYMAYNPREVTHDHVFHDHGEIPSDVDITREQMLLPPKISYTSQGQLIRGGRVNTKNVKKFSQKYPKTPKGQDDYRYYESMYSPYNKHYTPPQSTNPTFYGLSNDQNPGYNPSFNFRTAENSKTRYAGASPYFVTEKEVRDYGQQLSSAPSPFTLSSAIVHDYKPKPIGRPALANLKKFKDPLHNFKDKYNFNDFNAYASSANVHVTGDKTNNPFSIFQGKRDKKKSFSRQNLSFGGMDHQTHVDHLAGLQFPAQDGISSNLDSYSKFDDKGLNSATSTPYTIKESSPVHSYYSAMAAKALQETDPLSVGEASNDNFQYVAAPIPSTTSTQEPAVATTAAESDYSDNETDTLPTETIEFIEVRPMEMSIKPSSSGKKEKPISVFDLQEKKRPAESLPHRSSRFSSRQVPGIPQSSGSLKYGDRI